MANEPERPIEKLLRAAAQQQRDEAGAPLELHPANRRLLQGEVARRLAQPGGQPRPFLEVLGRLWPRLAWGAAICAVLAVAAYSILPVPGKGKPAARLARNEPLPKAALTPASQAPRADASAKEKLGLATGAQLAEEKKAVETEIANSTKTPGQAPAGSLDGDVQPRLRSAAKPAPPVSMPAEPAAPAPAPLTTAAAPAGNVASGESAKQTGDKASQFAFADKSMSASPLAKSSVAAKDGFLKPAPEARQEAGSADYAMRFARVSPGPVMKSRLADKAAPAPSVLASFQVQQTGPDLRIVDADGSVYSGYVQPADANLRRRLSKAEAPAASRDSGAVRGTVEAPAPARPDSFQPSPQTYYFRVTGTNRTLNQAVVFTGNLLTATNLASLRLLTNSLSSMNGIGGTRSGAVPPATPSLIPSQITGKVVVGDGKPVEINALPSSP